MIVLTLSVSVYGPPQGNLYTTFMSQGMCAQLAELCTTFTTFGVIHQVAPLKNGAQDASHDNGGPNRGHNAGPWFTGDR